MNEKKGRYQKSGDDPDICPFRCFMKSGNNFFMILLSIHVPACNRRFFYQNLKCD